MRITKPFLSACLIAGFAALACAVHAQSAADYVQLCSDPHPDVRLLACAVVIELKQAQGEGLADAYTSRGTAHLILGDSARAIADFDAAIALSPQRPLLFTYRGDAHLAKGEYAPAIADFTAALMREPNSLDALYGRATAWSASGDADRAIGGYSDVLARDPDYLEALAYRGIAYRSKEDYPHALADFDRLVQLSPRDAQALNLRGSTYRDSGDTMKALADYDEGLGLEPDNTALLDNRGFTELVAGHFDSATLDLARAVALRPDYAYHLLWLDLARIEGKAPAAGEFAEARKRLDASAWPAPVLRYYGGDATADDVRRAAAADPDVAARPRPARTASWNTPAP